jgi:hypothetical protein
MTRPEAVSAVAGDEGLSEESVDLIIRNAKRRRKQLKQKLLRVMEAMALSQAGVPDRALSSRRLAEREAEEKAWEEGLRRGDHRLKEALREGALRAEKNEAALVEMRERDRQVAESLAADISEILGAFLAGRPDRVAALAQKLAGCPRRKLEVIRHAIAPLAK